jgi:hypothetical protein
VGVIGIAAGGPQPRLGDEGLGQLAASAGLVENAVGSLQMDRGSVTVVRRQALAEDPVGDALEMPVPHRLARREHRGGERSPGLPVTAPDEAVGEPHRIERARIEQV